MEKTRLDGDEAELLTSYERGEWRSIRGSRSQDSGSTLNMRAQP